jgi:hypothetical protein
LHRNIPTAHCVALGAVGAELAAMNIRVAVRTVLPDIGEDGPEMALRAVNFFVHSAKGISRGVVVEFWDRANRGPARARVTILAGYRKGSVRTPAGLLLCIRRADESKCQQKEREPRADLERSENHCPPKSFICAFALA